MVDELIEEMARERKHRVVLLIAAVIGILASAAGGLAFALGAIGRGAATMRNPGALVFFVAPFAVAMAIGYAIYGVLRWRARRRAAR
ncbi:MAG TPA: hypothetical protein VLX92_35310 [Kofleriaceae bacterium]|nr:hypothetical protein [Kofleriaceae bacterium]